MKCRVFGLAVIFVCAPLAFSGLVRASEPGKSGGADAAVMGDSAVIDYCLNISDKAADLRAARQTETLKALEEKLDAKIKELEARRVEVQTWVERQQKLQQAAEAGLVEIYATMDPDAAAKQLSTLDAKLASSVLRQLKPRQASTIMNEMKPDQAALLIKAIMAATKHESNLK